MTTKDWILLLVPIFCNGIVVFALQKAFEKRQLVLAEKYKYVSIMQQKVDDALASFARVLQTAGDDMAQISWLNQFISSYSDVFYYYQQNEALFKSLKSYMDELIKTHEYIKDNQHRIDDEKSSEAGIHLETPFRKIYKILQSIQSDCINHKI